MLPTRRALVRFSQPAVHIGAAVSHLPARKAQEVRAAAFEPPVFKSGDGKAQIFRGLASGHQFSSHNRSSLIDKSTQPVFNFDFDPLLSRASGGLEGVRCPVPKDSYRHERCLGASLDMWGPPTATDPDSIGQRDTACNKKFP